VCDGPTLPVLIRPSLMHADHVYRLFIQDISTVGHWLPTGSAIDQHMYWVKKVAGR